jgi:hypothetical protein
VFISRFYRKTEPLPEPDLDDVDDLEDDDE